MTRIDRQASAILQTQSFIGTLQASLDAFGAGGKVITGDEARALLAEARPLPRASMNDLKASVRDALTAPDHWKCDPEARSLLATFAGVPLKQMPPAVDPSTVARTPSVDASAAAPELSPEVRALLAAHGVPLPAMGVAAPQDGVLNLLSELNSAGADQALAPGLELPAESYFGQAELAANLDAMYGAGAAQGLAHAEMVVQQGQLALLAALQGASPQDLAALLGNGPQADALAQQVCALARLLLQAPPDLQALGQAVMQADRALLDLAAPPGQPQRPLLEALFQEQYGVQPSAGDRPGGQPPRYSGGGAYGNQVQHTGVAEPPAGAFKAGRSSEAGLKALQAAQSQVGVREASGNNDGIPAQRYAGGRREPWCADFVSWCFRQTGQPLPGNQRSLASVQYMEDQMKKAGTFIPRGSAQPKPGDIIFFKNRGASDAGGGRHVGIVEKVENGKVYTIEGNSSNRVARRSYALSNARISGYGRS